MKKAQKQEMLEMVQTLHQAHDEIKENIDRKNFILAQDMLSQCQECAISIGNAIEKLEGEGFVTVPFIEAYCDVLFTTFEELNGSDANANKIYKNLKKQLLRIENSIKNDVPIRKEVAFFPYKASMWDSLESVYLAAKEDPDCDAYCVPIPYYDRNADGSLGKMHYEGREYPKNIEVIDWQTYNFEERKPDVIYIHNPYDDWNLVTCVHPRYFSANLKKYTDKLVYIPYFVLDEIEPDDQTRIDNMKHFVWTPGVVNADKVVVQSEKMKQIYINEYLKAAQKNGLQGKHTDRKYLEEKFLGTGSPKFDKVLNTKKEDLEIPEEWLRIIEKPDGSWKKIIFYNTSIAALLENNEKMLEKMKDVFRIFKENKDEVALLWRPHPLIKSTVSAMRPQLWVEYEKIVNQYKEEGWGIYDDSSDMDRAVVLSDAYYGDHSSVVQVYQKTGKPVMIQSIDLVHTNENDKQPITISDIVMTGDTCFGVSLYENMLLQIDLEKGKVSYVDYIKNEESNFGLYFTGILRKNQIFWLPYSAKEICVFDINEKCQKKIKLPSAMRNINIKFGVSLLYNDMIYAFGYEKPIILTFECSSMSMKIIDLSEKDDFADTKAFFKYAYCVVKNKVYLPMQMLNRVLEFDMDTQQYKIYELNDDTSIGYTAILHCNSDFRLFNWSDEEIIWNPDKGIIERKKIGLLPRKVFNKVYRAVFNEKNEVKVPFFYPVIYVSNSNEENMKLNFSDMIGEKIRDDASRFIFVKQIGIFVYFQLNVNYRWFKLNLDTMKLEEVFITISNTEIAKMMQRKQKSIFRETPTVTINNFILFV